MELRLSSDFHPPPDNGPASVEFQLRGGFPPESDTVYLVEEASTLPLWLSFTSKTFSWRPSGPTHSVRLEMRASRQRMLPKHTLVGMAVPMHVIREAAKGGRADFSGIDVAAKVLLLADCEVNDQHFDRVQDLDVDPFLQYR